MQALVFTGIGKLCKGILIDRWGVFLFIGENSTAVCKELVGDTVSCENLMENVVIAIQSFLGIKPTAGNPSCSIIYSQMQMPYLSGDPFVGSCVHLLQFTEISGSGTAGMGVLKSNKINLYLIRFFLRFRRFFIGF